MVSSSSADGTRTLPRIFRGGSVSFRFKTRGNLLRCGQIFFNILIPGNLAMFEYISKLYRCLNKRRVYPAQTIQKSTNGREMSTGSSAKETNTKHKLCTQTNRWLKALLKYMTASKFVKEVLKIGRRNSSFLEYAESGCFTSLLCKGRQRNRQRIIMHAAQLLYSLPLSLRFAKISVHVTSSNSRIQE